MKSSRGFTVIELIIVVVVLGAASVLFFIQKNHVESAARDDARKTAINSMYYGLEEVYYKENQAYPRTIDSTILPSVNPDLFNDPNGTAIGEGASDYRYEGTDCNGDTCKSYTLRTTLENEDDFVKENRNS
jgi:prepilin-type N-terminal cleavage/methylation domain-containing protein